MSEPSAPGASLPSEEALLLTKADAKVLLEAHCCTVLTVLRVDVDCIAYLGHGNRPMTAWLQRRGVKVDVRTESGFPAEPAYGLLPRPDVSKMYPEIEEQEA